MPRTKLPLKLTYGHMVGAEVDELAAELRNRFPVWGRLPPSISRNPYVAVASIALHPGILAETEFCAGDKRDFAGCFKRYPDQVIEALRLVRQLASERERKHQDQRQKDDQTQAGRVRRFLCSTTYIAKKKGKFIALEKLTAADYRPDRQTLLPTVKMLAVSALQDGEVAEFLDVTTASVTKARQSLARSG
jgi:hypothetical protein